MGSEIAVTEVLDEWRLFIDATDEPAAFDSIELSRVAGRVLESARSLQRTLDPIDPRSEHARAAENSTLAAERLSIEVLGAQLAENDASIRSLSLQSFNALMAAGDSLQLAMAEDDEAASPVPIDLTTSVPLDTDIHLDEPIDLREESQILSAVKPALEVDGAALRRAVSSGADLPPVETSDVDDAPSAGDPPDDPAIDLVIESTIDDLTIEPDPMEIIEESTAEDEPTAAAIEPDVTLEATPIEVKRDEFPRDVLAEEFDDEPIELAEDLRYGGRQDGRIRRARKKDERIMRVQALRAEREVVRRNHMERLAAGHEVTVRSRSRLFLRTINAILVGTVMVGVVIGGALLAAFVSRTWF
ncbi:MAG: hypothetical protein HKN94_08160 [Acidimicrobiales bacterium]|nr:hypothetical protein [Acidimicrobiales bacterium]RZV48490.1 MAG: hypothetical protein EX269_01525 [Acidimicrobiales bacterium]